MMNKIHSKFFNLGLVSLLMLSAFTTTLGTTTQPSSISPQDDSSPQSRLINELSKTKSDDERNALLDANPGLLTADLVNILRGQGYKYFVHGQAAPSLACYQSGLLVARRLEDKALVAKMLESLGFYYEVSSDYQTSAQYYQQSVDVAREINNKGRVAVSLTGLGNIDRIQGNYQRAIERLEEALRLAKESGVGEVISNVALRLSVVHNTRGDYLQALEYAQLSVDTDKRFNLLAHISSAYSYLGEVYSSLGDYPRALNTLDKALKYAEAAGPDARHQRGHALFNMLTVHHKLGDYGRALELGQQALSIARGMNAPGTYADVLTSVAEIQLALGNTSQAIEMYTEALSLADKMGVTAVQLRLYNNLGQGYLSRKDFVKSVAYARSGLELAKKVGNKPEEWNALITIGNISRAKGDYTGAAESYSQALQIAEQINNRPLITESLAELGSAYYLQGNVRQALDASTRASEGAKQLGMDAILWKAQTTLGRCYGTLEQPETAQRFLSEAVNTVENLSSRVTGSDDTRLKFIGNKTEPYYELVSLLIERGENWEALRYAERTKARVLGDILRYGRPDVQKSMSPEEAEKERLLTYRLVSLNGQLKQARAAKQQDESLISDLNKRLGKARLEFESFQTNLYAKQPALRVRRAQYATVSSSSDAIRLAKVSNSTIVQYVTARNKLHLFVIAVGEVDRTSGEQRAGIEVISLPFDDAQLASTVREFRTQLGERDLNFTRLSRLLYDLLIRPVEQKLPLDTPLCIIPDGVLWELPFQALQRDPGNYLMDRHPIFYAHSLGVLNEMLRAAGLGEKSYREENSSHDVQTPVQREVLAVGNPQIGRSAQAIASIIRGVQDLGPLPDAEREVNSLPGIFGRSNARVLVGPDALEETVKRDAPHYRTLHFATHGTLDDRSPLYSNLLLATNSEGAAEDGLLEAWEVMNLDLQANLVTLSACDTARGSVSPGEGLIGMSWAFFAAGSSSLVSSQWKVDSASTSKLMIKMYTLLKKTPHSSAAKARALQRAALELRRNPQYELPYYWAGFILIGNPN